MHQRRKRLFDHVVVHVRDIDESKRFYRAVVETLGHVITAENQRSFFIDELEVRQDLVTTKSVQLAFNAENPGSVKLFHDTAVRFGGKSVVDPRESIAPGVYSARVLDPDGNTIEALFKGTQKSVSISY